eukprot:6462749-Amphidinium_carterae.2
MAPDFPASALVGLLHGRLSSHVSLPTVSATNKLLGFKSHPPCPLQSRMTDRRAWTKATCRVE